MPRYVLVTLLMGQLAATSAAARSPGDPIRLAWQEGDVAGTTSVYDGAGDGASRQAVGMVEYHQRREGDLLTTRRLLRFRDGSSDEDVAVARVGSVLTAVSGRSIV